VQAACPDARVAAAFHLIPAAAFAALDTPLESDVIACADADDARDAVLGIIEGIPNLRGFDGGSLSNAIGIETFAALLLTVNLRHKGKGSLRLLGVDNHPGGAS
jgi:predicted dinucleotide-binding enzyme